MGEGRICFHSRDVGMWHAVRSGRCEARASHRMNMKKKREKKDIIDPTDEMMFHLKKASG